MYMCVCIYRYICNKSIPNIMLSKSIPIQIRNKKKVFTLYTSFQLGT